MLDNQMGLDDKVLQALNAKTKARINRRQSATFFVGFRGPVVLHETAEVEAERGRSERSWEADGVEICVRPSRLSPLHRPTNAANGMGNAFWAFLAQVRCLLPPDCFKSIWATDDG